MRNWSEFIERISRYTASYVSLRLLSLLICFSSIGLWAVPLQNGQQISGVVIDENGEPLIGVAIQVKGTTSGTVTDFDGNFVLNVPSSKSVLVFSYIGYNTQEITVGTNKVLKVQMDVEDTVLDEVVVIAYGTQSKVSVTGSVASIKTDEIKQSPAPNLVSALTGKLPGLTTVQNTGMPGEENFQMYLRGAATSNSTNPLILIDGVPRDNINSVDPNEVESISVLKDASSTAVFGVRGANGVILITTKQGTTEKPTLSISAEFGRQDPTREIHQVDSWDHAILRNQALYNDGLGEYAAYSQRQIDLFKAGTSVFYPNTDWWDIAMKSYAPQNRYNVNLSGGTDRVKYFVNMGMLNQGGIFKTESKDVLGYDPQFKLNRYNFRTNLNIKINDWIKSGLNLAAYIDKKNKAVTMSPTLSTSPLYIYSSLYQTNATVPGPLTTEEMGVQPGIPTNVQEMSNGGSPYTNINSRGYQSTDQSTLNSSLFFDFDFGWLTKGLSSKIMVSFDTKGQAVTTASRQVYALRYSVSEGKDEAGNVIDIPSFVQNINPDYQPLSFSKSSTFQYTINMQWQINYARMFRDKHHVSGMFLMQRDNSEAASGGSDMLLPYNVLGFSGRVAYRYDDRYMLEFNAGYNGSEQFAPGKRFGFFPAGSVGWVVSNEPFMKKIKAISNLKLRASYGMVGNDKLGNARFLYLDNYVVNNSGGFSASLGNGGYINQTLVANPNITWEIAYKQNYGIDLGFLNNSLNFVVDVYNERRENILIPQRSRPTLLGLPVSVLPKANLGIINNKGFELEGSYNKRINKDWSLYVKGTFSYNENKVIEKDEVPMIDEQNPYMSPYREEGYSLNQPFGYKIDWNSPGKGYYTSQEEIDNSGLTFLGVQPRPGDFVYKDLNGDKVIDQRDEVAIGYGNIPRINYSAMFNVSYKGFDLSLMFQGVSKFSTYYQNWGVFESNAQSGSYFEIHKKAWTEQRYKEGLEITYPALSASTSYSHKANDFFIIDRSYLRLKNFEIGYTFPKSWVKKIWMQDARIYINGQNLLTWDKLPFEHFDPEQSGATTIPINRVINLGVNVKF